MKHADRAEAFLRTVTPYGLRPNDDTIDRLAAEFAAGRAEERQECAATCKQRGRDAEEQARHATLSAGRWGGNLMAAEAYECAAAIHARGEGLGAPALHHGADVPQRRMSGDA